MNAALFPAPHASLVTSDGTEWSEKTASSYSGYSQLNLSRPIPSDLPVPVASFVLSCTWYHLHSDVAPLFSTSDVSQRETVYTPFYE